MIDKLAFGSYNDRIPDAGTPFDWLCTDEGVVDAYMKDKLCGFTFTVNGFQTLFTLLDRLNQEENLLAMPGALPVHLSREIWIRWAITGQGCGRHARIFAGPVCRGFPLSSIRGQGTSCSMKKQAAGV